MNMADLNSVLSVPRLIIDDSEQRGILRNKTNTLTNKIQQKNITVAPTTVSEKHIRFRSTSVQSKKSLNEVIKDDERNPNLTIKAHPKKYTVAFGQTTNFDETLTNIRPLPISKPPIGSTKDIMDLRKTVEAQTAQLQSQQTEIQMLKDAIEVQQQNYRYLLDSNSKIWTTLNSLQKQISPEAMKSKSFEHLMAKKMASENIFGSNINTKDHLKDSVTVKLNKENDFENQKIQNRNYCNDEQQLVVAPANIKFAVHENEKENAISGIQRILNANPNFAKEIEKLAKNLQKKESESLSEEENLIKRKKDYKNGRKNHRDRNAVVEKITVERTIYSQLHNRVLESPDTVDDILQKFGLDSIVDETRHNHGKHDHKHLPNAALTICEISSSSESSESENEIKKEKLNRRKRSPTQPHARRRERRIKDSDAENRKSEIETTNLPGNFDYDKICSDDTVSQTMPPPPKKDHRRQNVGDRLKKRRC